MDRDKKITLSLFLTWVVFGLFNLFGQPQAFVPLIIIDGLMVTGLGIYFLLPFRKNTFYFALIVFTVFMAILSLIETNWINITSFWKYFISLSGLLFCALLSLGGIYFFRKNPFLFSITLLISLFLAAGFYILISNNNSPIFTAFYLYFAAGILSLAGILIHDKKDEISESLHRLLLVFTLNFLFDIGNYLALLQFTSN
jgi:hypothetical protein